MDEKDGFKKIIFFTLNIYTNTCQLVL